MNEYNFSEIEKKWQKKWNELNIFHSEVDYNKEKFYGLIEFPYPSGSGLHVGHQRSCTAMDIICRKKRAENFNVLFPIGFDAFGLPAENYALKTGVSPEISTKEAITKFTQQLKSMGYSFDWSRCVETIDSNYYKWTQWIFIKLFEHGLAYKKEIPVNYCPSCKTGLANEEVIDGNCERCGNETCKKNKSQWILKITNYAEELIDDLKTVNFLEKIKTQQINWIGKSSGAEINFTIKLANNKESKMLKYIGEKINVFTTRPETIFGVTGIALSPLHPLALEIAKHNIQIGNFIEEYKKSNISAMNIDTKEKKGIHTDLFAEHPFIDYIDNNNKDNNKNLDIYIANFVLNDYGTGAVMMVPGHDERDYEFMMTLK